MPYSEVWNEWRVKQLFPEWSIKFTPQSHTPLVVYGIFLLPYTTSGVWEGMLGICIIVLIQYPPLLVWYVWKTGPNTLQSGSHWSKFHSGPTGPREILTNVNLILRCLDQFFIHTNQEGWVLYITYYLWLLVLYFNIMDSIILQYNW